MSVDIQKTKTDWQRYYARPYLFSRWTQHLLAARITYFVKKYMPGEENISIAEFGGANSFMAPILNPLFKPSQYHIIDNHPSKNGALAGTPIHFHHRDILDGGAMPQADLTFSVGLIEHFSPEDTRRAIEAHMNGLKPSGISIMTFPTPTWLYKTSRGLLEACGTWIFHDERALMPEEVKAEVLRHGTVLNCEVIWPMVLTQAVLVMKKRGH